MFCVRLYLVLVLLFTTFSSLPSVIYQSNTSLSVPFQQILTGLSFLDTHSQGICRRITPAKTLWTKILPEWYFGCRQSEAGAGCRSPGERYR